MQLKLLAVEVLGGLSSVLKKIEMNWLTFGQQKLSNEEIFFCF